MDINLPQFTQADVVRVSRISAKTLQNWIEPSRAILRTAERGMGRGNRRLYSAMDVMALVMFSHLVALGVAPAVASALFYADVRPWFEMASAEGAGQHVCRIYFDEAGPVARLLTGPNDFNGWLEARSDLDHRRFAHIEVNLSDIAAFVVHELEDVLTSESDEATLSPAEQAVQAMRRARLRPKED